MRTRFLEILRKFGRFSATLLIIFTVSLFNYISASADTGTDLTFPYFSNKKGECYGGSQGGSVGEGNFYILGDSISYGLQLDGLEQKIKDKFPGKEAKINYDGGRSITGPGTQAGVDPHVNALDAAENDKDYIKGSGTIIIVLGTNQTDAPFDVNLKALLDKLKGPDFAPNAKYYWVDIGANAAAQAAGWSARNGIIYDKAATESYSVISRYKAIFGQDKDPLNIDSSLTQLTANGGDGIHGGYPQLSEAILSSLTSSPAPAAAPQTLAATTETPTTPTTPTGSTTTLTVDSPQNKTYNGLTIWTQEDINKINEFKPVYEDVSREAGIPWQLMAVLHKIESGFAKSNPSNGQGLFQDYQGLNGPYPTGPVTDEEFRRQAIWAANLAKGKSQYDHPSNNKDLNTEGGMKFTLMAFNGLGGGQFQRQAADRGFDGETQMYEGSSYVVNYSDDKSNPEVTPTWGGYVGDGTFGYPAPKNIGTYHRYAAIAGLQSSTEACSGDGGGVASCDGGSTGTRDSLAAQIVSHPKLKLGNSGSAATQKTDIEGQISDKLAVAMVCILEKSGVDLPINAIKSDHSAGGDHGVGRALDIGYYGVGQAQYNENGAKLYKFIYENREQLGLSQVIWQYPQDGLQCVYGGEPANCDAAYPGDINDHYHHIHMAVDG